MGRFLRFGLMGCGAFVVLTFVIVALALLFGGGGTETAGSDPGGPTAPEEPGEPENESADPAPAQSEPAPAAGIGEPVPVGNVAWQVTNARQVTELASEFGESKQGNFVIVDFIFQNNGNEAVTLDSSSVSLVDGQGRESQVDTDNFMFIDPSKDVFLQQVNPGVSREGEVIYTVAPGTTDFALSVGDTNMFGGEEATIDLGF